MKIAVLAPIAWRTPPLKYGPWEKVASMLTENLVKKGHDVTLFATGDSVTSAKLRWVCETPYEIDKSADPKVLECLHISFLMEKAAEFDIIHNHFDFLPLTYSRLIKTPMITTIHGFSSEKILPVYIKYNSTSAYISISNANRHPDLSYLETIYHGLEPSDFIFSNKKENYLLYFGRIHPDKGLHSAIEISEKSGLPLKIAGLIQDDNYFNSLFSKIDGQQIEYLGNLGREDSIKLLTSAKALLHPIYFEEPFGLSVLEAMMSGTPVIAFNKGSMPELIVNGKTGFLIGNVAEAVNSIDKLEKIEPEDCRRHAIQNFSIDKMTDSYIRAYKKVLNQ
ncbi:glycosyltransferase family 4 protein [Christiangramia aquimixticola]|uniref:glycosyltransferase family 4 protein n=1 Tax=Christiangramia aquimixticola TaxID=1697558 RepID=UPI003AA8F9BD